MSRYQFTQDCTEPWPVQVLCHVLGVSCAGYYQWRGRAQPTPVPWKMAAQQASFLRHAARYRTSRLRACGPRVTLWAATPCVRGYIDRTFAP